MFVQNVAANGRGEWFGKAAVSQGHHMPKTAVVVQQGGDEELPPGTIPFTSAKIPMVSSSGNVSEAPGRTRQSCVS